MRPLPRGCPRVVPDRVGHEAVFYGLEDLPQRYEELGLGPRVLALAGRAQQLDSGLVDSLFELRTE